MEMNNHFQTAEELMQESRKTAEPAPTEPSAEAKEKPARKNKKERLEEVKAKLKTIREEIKTLKANKSKTESEKQRLATLNLESDNLKIEQATLKKDIEAEKYNAVIREQKKKLADRKQEAIIKLLEAEGLNTENSVKALIGLRRVCLEFNVKDGKTLKRYLEKVKDNAPQMLNDGQ